MAIDKKSRYVKSSTGTAVDPGGEAFDYLELREIPTAGGFFQRIADATDRLDLLAQRYYRDPTKFWKICDGSDHLDPFDVVAPNQPVLIPPDK